MINFIYFLVVHLCKAEHGVVYRKEKTLTKNGPHTGIRIRKTREQVILLKTVSVTVSLLLTSFRKSI